MSFRKESVFRQAHSKQLICSLNLQSNALKTLRSSDHVNRIYYNVPRTTIPTTQLYRIPIKIGKISTKALVDMGAAASIMSPILLHRIPTESIKPINNHKEITFAGFTGDTVPSYGTFKIPFIIQNKHYFEHDFHVVPNTTDECILGLDFMHKYGISFNGQTGSIFYDKDGITHKLINSISPINKTKNESIKEIPNFPPLDHVTPNQKKIISTLLNNYSQLYGSDLGDLNSNLPIKHRILLTERDSPIFIPHYRTPFHQRPLLQEHITNLLKNGIIRPSSSPYGSPCLLVAKKDGSTRFVVDYRKLNSFTIRDRYPLPRLDESIESFFGAKYFTTLDLLSGYHQIEVDENDKPKTAFTSELGHYEYNRMPFGLTNAPATFQRLMNFVLQQHLYKIVVVYLDDIIIFSKTFAQHIKDIETIFAILWQSQLKLNLKKCSFFHEQVLYLGHIISSKGVSPDPKKQEAIDKYPVPTNVDQLRSFLGLANYYRKFVDNFADKAHCLTMLTKKSVKFEWSDQQDKAFNLLKKTLTNPPILRFPDFTREFIVYTDASGYGVGAVLGQVQLVDKQDKEIVIAYFSKHLTERQQRWCVTEREALAIILAVQNFHPYLYGRRFTVITDHKPLEWLMNLKKPNSRLLRWSLELQQYDIAIGYKPGVTHQNADCLSRIPINVINNVTDEWRQLQRNDPFCKAALLSIINFNKGNNKTLHELQSPTALSGQTIDSQNPDVGIEQATNKRLKKCKYILLTGNLVGTKKGQILVPKDKITEVLNRYHDHKLAGHLGITKTINRIRPKFNWPKMDKDITDYVSTCDICQKRKSFTNKKAPMQPLPIVNRLWERIACDIIGPIATEQQKYKYILTILEYETRFAKAFPLKNTVSTTIAKIFIDHIILQHGLPSSVLTDRGTNLIAGAMQELCDSLNIEQIKTTAFHPQTDGLVEKFNGTLGNMLSAYSNKNPSVWPTYLQYCVFAYNTSIHASTKETPFYLLYGHDPIEPFDLLPNRTRSIENNDSIFFQQWRQARDLAKIYIEAAQSSQKYYYDKDSSSNLKFKVGDKVILREMRVGLGKFHLRWDGPFTIIKKLSNVNYVIRKDDSLTDIVVHVNRLRTYRDRGIHPDNHADSDSDSDNSSVNSDSSTDSEPTLQSQQFNSTINESSQEAHRIEPTGSPVKTRSRTTQIQLNNTPQSQESHSDSSSGTEHPQSSTADDSSTHQESNIEQIPEIIQNLQPRIVLRRLSESDLLQPTIPTTRRSGRIRKQPTRYTS